MNKLYFSSPNLNGVILNSQFIFVRNNILNLIRNQKLSENYEEISTPVLCNKDLYKKTGHIDYFSQNMFSVDNMYLKPMSCPGAALYVKNNFNNNQNIFPKKIFEFGNVFRRENSGSCKTLFRCMNFTQDDSHIFCSLEEQVISETSKLVEKYLNFYKLLNWNVSIHLSLPKNDSLLKINKGKIIKLIEDILISLNVKYFISKDEGAFYGPKIDFLLDNINQLSTIQIDYFLSRNLNVKFFNEKESFFPIVIHTAMLGSLERFMYFLLEKNNQIFPFWCSKFIICNLIEKEKKDTVERICNFFLANKLNFLLVKNATKIARDNKHFPIIFIGDKEIQKKQVSIKNFFSKEQKTLDIEEFFNYINVMMNLFNLVFTNENF